MYREINCQELQGSITVYAFIPLKRPPIFVGGLFAVFY